MNLGTQRVPAATRATAPGWRDPRMWVGVLIVAVSVVVGARVLAAADDTVAVWAVSTDAGPGAELAATDLVAHRVRFADPADRAGYFTVDDELPAAMLLVRGVGAGELLPRAAVGVAGRSSEMVELPVAVDPDQVPPSVDAGSVVDVYLLGTGRERDLNRDQPADPALDGATVVDVSSPDGGFGATTGRRQLVLAVPDDAAAAFLAAVGAVDNPVLTVVRRG